MKASFKTSVLAIGAVAAFALGGTAIGHATTGDAGDYFLICNPGCVASTGATHVTGHSGHTAFTVPAGVSGAPTVTCTNSIAGDNPPAKSAGLATTQIKPLPVFNDGSATLPCKDQFGNKYTETSFGTWLIGFTDNPSETATEPNGGDKLFVKVPKAGAVVKSSNGCVITVAPNAGVTVTGAYSDGVSGTYNFSVNIKILPVHVTQNPNSTAKCPIITPPTVSCAGQTPAFCSSFVGVYAFKPGVRDAA